MANMHSWLQVQYLLMRYFSIGLEPPFSVFLPQFENNQSELLTVILTGFIIASSFIIFSGILVAQFWSDSTWAELIFIGIFLTLAQAWFSINLELARSRLTPKRYGIISLFKAVVSLGFGTVLVWKSYGAFGALIALFVGFLSAGIWASWGQWGISFHRQLFNRKLICSLLSYGLPLTASYALSVVISSTDRFMLAGIINESATGLYAAGQGFPQQTIGVILTMINLAAYPLIVQSQEQKSPSATRSLIRKNTLLLLGIGLPVTAGFIVLAPTLAKIFLGIEFQVAAIDLIPLVAIATLLSGIRGYWLDIAFYLGKKTYFHGMIMFAAALINVACNFWLIPLYGLIGAAYATIAAHVAAVLLSAILGRHAFRLPNLFSDIAKLMVATLIMVVILYILPSGEGLLTFTSQIVLGGSVYLGCVITFNIGDVKVILKSNVYQLKKRLASSSIAE